MRNIDPRILAVCDGYRRSVLEKDAVGFLGLYHPDARVFDTWGTWSYEGAGERRKAIEGWFSSLGDERVRVTFDRVSATVAGGLATLSARVGYAAVSAAGEELRAMQNRLTWVLREESGGWRIVHEHTSVPIGPNDLRGILRSE